MNATLRIRTLGILVSLAVSAPADARLDAAGLGTGRDGTLNVTAPDTAINRYAALVASAQAGASSVRIDDPAAFAAGDLVLLWQATGREPVPSGAQAPVVLDGLEVGRWILERVVSVQGDRLVLAAPLSESFPAGLTQAVRVPEYEALTVAAGASVVAAPWDGRVGGIVAFLVDGPLRVDGRISATGAGHRGGETVLGDGTRGCAHLDTSVPDGAWKGEGIDGDGYGAHQAGRGNVASGGGGGVCRSSGGGGGGSAGRGGIGGRSASRADGSRDVGGLGGAPLVYSVHDRLLPGGGGGGGHGKDGESTAGGAGGGVILVRAASLSGEGFFEADGLTPPAPPAGGRDGQGGGGGGGTIVLRVAGEADCGGLRATGGDGGSTPADGVGPGGGGGGGRVLLQADGGACPVDVSAGVAGTQTAGAPYGPRYGAEPEIPTVPEHIGRVEPAPEGGLPILVAPRFEWPAEGEGVDTPRPTISGVADAGREVVIRLGGAETGRVFAGDDGAFSWTPQADLAEGRHVLTARALHPDQYVASPWSAPHVFYVGEPVVEPDPPEGVDPASPVQIDVAEIEACPGSGAQAWLSVTPLALDGGPRADADVDLQSDWPFLRVTDRHVTWDEDAGAWRHDLALEADRCTGDGEALLTVFVDGQILDTRPAIALTCPPVEADGVSLSLSSDTVPGDGSRAATATVSLVDVCGLPAFGRAVSLRGLGEVTVTVSPATRYSVDRPGDEADGTATFEVLADGEGEVAFEVWVDDTRLHQADGSLTATPTVVPPTISLTSGVVSAVPGQVVYLIGRVSAPADAGLPAPRVALRTAGLVDDTGAMTLKDLSSGESVEARFAVRVAVGATTAWARLAVSYDDGAGDRTTVLSDPVHLVVVDGAGGGSGFGFECSGAGGSGGDAGLLLVLALLLSKGRRAWARAPSSRSGLG